MANRPDWNEVRERLEQLLPHSLDETTWQALQRHSLTFVANELLWRVEAIAKQVPAQGTMYLKPLTRTDRQHEGNCALCSEQPGSGIGQRCTRCVAALSLVLGFPLLLDDVGLIAAGEAVASDEPSEQVTSHLFEL